MRANPQETADVVTFTEEILNAKLYYLCFDNSNLIAKWFYIRIWTKTIAIKITSGESIIVAINYHKIFCDITALKPEIFQDLIR